MTVSEINVHLNISSLDLICRQTDDVDTELLEFSTLSIIWYSKNWKTQLFGNWICFHVQVSRETPPLLGPLERANLNHWITHASVTTAT
jgi:hypothetical protein